MGGEELPPEGGDPSDGAMMSIGGQAVTVQFNHSDIGGSVTIGNQTVTLTAGVDTLPE